MIKCFIFFASFMTIMHKSCGQVNKKFNCQTCSQKDSEIVKKLEKMNFDDYKDKEVSVFWNDLGFKFLKYIPFDKKPGYIWKVIFRYSDSLSVDIRVSNLKQTKPLGLGYTFNEEEFKKKKILMICFRYAGECIKGCEGDLMCR